jgi:hypothetical protein
MLGSKPLSPEILRHRLLEGVLVRLARLPDADRFVLRGGMLMRLWFRPWPRPAGDLDLTSPDEFSVEETARRFRPLLADRDVDDGVTFDPEWFHARGIWLNTKFPGVRLFACGEVDGVEDDFTVDVTFGESLVPRPEYHEYPLDSGQTVGLWMCRPETIVGRKLHALMQMGTLHWRPKDLNDLRLLLGHVPLDFAELAGAIACSFTSRGNTAAEARAVFTPASWWEMKMSAARWRDFVEESAEESTGRSVPENLSAVVAEVATRLQPVWEQLS